MVNLKSILWIQIVTLAIFMLTSCSTLSPKAKTTASQTTTTQATSSATATQTASSTSRDNAARDLAANKITSWHITGKISIQTAQNTGSGTLNWTQNHGQYAISLTGPLGSGGFKLEGRPGFVSLVTNNGKHITASSPEALSAKEWGWRLPVSNLDYWIRGLPAPNSAHQAKYDDAGRLAYLSQQGFRVQYLGYANTQPVLPNKIFITSKALNVRIVVYNWGI